MRGLLVIAAAIAASSPATAQSTCGARDKFVKLLQERYGEQRKFTAIAGQRLVAEVFVSKGGGTWSLVVTNAQGYSCMMAGGHNWQEEKLAARGEDL